MRGFHSGARGVRRGLAAVGGSSESGSNAAAHHLTAVLGGAQALVVDHVADFVGNRRAFVLRHEVGLHGVELAGGAANLLANAQAAYDRGEYRWDDITSTDLSLNYDIKVYKVEFFAQAEVRNAFNEQAQVNGNTSGELLVLSWGGTYGACTTAVERCQSEELDVAPSTVRSHLKHVYAKLRLKTRPEAISYAIRHGVSQG